MNSETPLGKMFLDISKRCSPSQFTVYARSLQEQLFLQLVNPDIVD